MWNGFEVKPPPPPPTTKRRRIRRKATHRDDWCKLPNQNAVVIYARIIKSWWAFYFLTLGCFAFFMQKGAHMKLCSVYSTHNKVSWWRTPQNSFENEINVFCSMCVFVLMLHNVALAVIADFYTERIKCKSIQFIMSRLSHINQLNGWDRSLNHRVRMCGLEIWCNHGKPMCQISHENINKHAEKTLPNPILS